MKLAFVALTFALFGAGQVLAADLPLPGPPPGARYFPAAQYNWGGGYFGLNGGYAFGSSDWTLNGVSTGSFQTNGFLFGGTLGGNFQIGRFVLGLEADLDWAGLTGSSSVAACGVIGVPAGAACQTKSDWLSTARGRVGYALDRFLVYATGGLALTDLQLATQAGSANDVIAGWTIGAGVEFAFADNWTIKAEYLFVDFGTTQCFFSQTICATAGFPSVSLSENIIRGGINYKFYW